MNDIILNLLVFTGFLVIAGIIFFLVFQHQKRENQKLNQLTQQKGWQIEHIQEPLAKGIKIIAPEWTLEAVSRSSGTEAGPGSTDMEQKTTWYANRPGSTILIGAKTSQVDLGMAGEMLLKQVMQSALGKDATGIEEVQIGSSAFQKQFMVWAQDIDEADKLLTPSVQSALLNWKKTLPLIKRTSSGITIELKGTHLRKPDEITALVHLGELFL